MPTSAKYIVYADDDQDDQDILSEVMNGIMPDVPIIPVRNGIELIDFLSSIPKGHKYPSLIILDINMPVVGGYQALKLLKLNPAYSHIPVVMFSTSTLQEDKKKSMRFGAVDYMSKPMHYPEVKQACIRFAELCRFFTAAVVS